MDRNTVIGFVLLALLFFGYFYYTRQGQMTLEQEKQHIQDSINRLKPKIDSTAKTGIIINNSSSHQDSSSTVSRIQPVKNNFSPWKIKFLKLHSLIKGGNHKEWSLKILKLLIKNH